MTDEPDLSPAITTARRRAQRLGAIAIIAALTAGLAVVSSTPDSETNTTTTLAAVTSDPTDAETERIQAPTIGAPTTSADLTAGSDPPITVTAPPPSPSTSAPSIGPKPTAGQSTTTTTRATTTAPPGSAVRIQPGESIQAAIDGNPPGTAFTLAPGIHTGQRITPKNGNAFSGEPGAVLSGMGQSDIAFVGGAHDVLIEGLVIEEFQTPAQFGSIHAVGDNWVIRNNEIRYNAGGGVQVGDGYRLIGNKIHHNGQIGVIGYEAVGALIQDNEISFNNFADRYQMQWEAGGAKLVRTNGLVLRGNYVHDNHGPGLWTDGDNYNSVIEGNRVVDNYGPGIFHEISYDAVIRNNVVEGNAARFFVGGILVTSSSNVEVHGNTVRGNNGGIVAIQEPRGSGQRGPYEVRNLWVHDNVVELSTGWTGLRQNIGNPNVYTWNNRFTGNDYVADPAAKLWFWMDGLRTLNEWLAYGLDAS